SGLFQRRILAPARCRYRCRIPVAGRGRALPGSAIERRRRGSRNTSFGSSASVWRRLWHAGCKQDGDAPNGTTGMLHAFWNALRYAIRSLRRAPGFAAAAIATIALGVGVNTGIYSVINGVLFRDLPVPDAHELVSIGQRIEGV